RGAKLGGVSLRLVNVELQGLELAARVDRLAVHLIRPGDDGVLEYQVAVADRRRLCGGRDAGQEHCGDDEIRCGSHDGAPPEDRAWILPVGKKETPRRCQELWIGPPLIRCTSRTSRRSRGRTRRGSGRRCDMLCIR